jgi:hypothetical protein
MDHERLDEMMPAWLTAFVWNVLASAVVAALLLGALGWLLREWIRTRLNAAIEHEYAKKLATFQAGLQREHDRAMEALRDAGRTMQTIRDAATGTFGSIHAVAHERRLKAIEVVWAAIVSARNETPSGLLLADAFPEDDYDRMFRVPQLSKLVSTIDIQNLPQLTVARSEDVEKWRPFMGEYIYALYEAYRTLTVRVLVETRLGLIQGKVTPWYREGVNRTVVAAVLTVEELVEFERSQTKLNYIRSSIERKVIAKAARIISGEASASHMLEQGSQIIEAVRKLEEASAPLPTV